MLTVDQALYASDIAKKILINTIPMYVIFTLFISNFNNLFINSLPISVSAKSQP